MQHERDDDIAALAELAAGAVRRERTLPGTADAAWELLRDADGLELWLADEVCVEIAPGERGWMREGDVVREVFVESVEEGRRLSLHWWTSGDDGSLVDLVIDERDGATRLVVTELPLRVVAVPAGVPASWDLPGASDAASGPQLLALACR